MVRHAFQSTSEDELSVAEPVDAEHAAAPADKFEVQFQGSQRLNEYYQQVVAEIRASLEAIGEGDGHAS